MLQERSRQGEAQEAVQDMEEMILCAYYRLRGDHVWVKLPDLAAEPNWEVATQGTIRQYFLHQCPRFIYYDARRSRVRLKPSEELVGVCGDGGEEGTSASSFGDAQGVDVVGSKPVAAGEPAQEVTVPPMTAISSGLESDAEIADQADDASCENTANGGIEIPVAMEIRVIAALVGRPPIQAGELAQSVCFSKENKGDFTKWLKDHRSVIHSWKAGPSSRHLRWVTLAEQPSRGWHRRCLDKLRLVVHEQLGLKWCVRAFGSAANGFGTEASDLDLSLIFVNNAGSSAAGEAEKHDALHVLKTTLPSIHCFSIAKFVSRAKVPVLKVQFEDQHEVHEVDITEGNYEALVNTQLLLHYSRIHSKVRRFVVDVKNWAKTEGCCGACTGHLSSYAFCLLGLYFLQTKAKLPALPVDVFIAGQVPALPVWAPHQSLEELMSGWLKFYAEEFDWEHEVVSVRHGKRLGIDHRLFEALPKSTKSTNKIHQRHLHIEDPVLPAVNLSCVLSKENEEYLKQKLTEASAERSVGLLSS
mmetsp:Transcript_69477/g.203290  ORF Transcript_69477/g.203290 Transcript_69477/m.203290 type:complete len:529 (-) Transcript_69477:109-1695(-)